MNKTLEGIKELKEQNNIIDSISQQCSCSMNQWQKVCEGLPQNIFIFVRKPIILQLANNKNLFRWEKSFFKWLRLCNANKQTLHMLNNCHEAVRNGRYTWRHESILFTICNYLITLKSTGLELFTDMAGFKNLDILFNGPRHDVVVKNGNKHCSRTIMLLWNEFCENS